MTWQSGSPAQYTATPSAACSWWLGWAGRFHRGLTRLSGPWGFCPLSISSPLCGPFKQPHSFPEQKQKLSGASGAEPGICPASLSLIRDGWREADSSSCWEMQWALREHGNGWWPSLELILSHTLYSCCEHDSKLKRKLLEPYLVHKTYKCLLLYRFKTRR